MKHALTIAGSDCSGGAGIQAELKTFAAHGVYGMSVIVSVVAENTERVISIEDISPKVICDQIDAVFTDIEVDAVKVGMLSGIEQMHAVADKLAQYRPQHIVIDPVMVAKGGCALMHARGAGNNEAGHSAAGGAACPGLCNLLTLAIRGYVPLLVQLRIAKVKRLHKPWTSSTSSGRMSRFIVSSASGCISAQPPLATITGSMTMCCGRLLGQLVRHGVHLLYAAEHSHLHRIHLNIGKHRVDLVADHLGRNILDGNHALCVARYDRDDHAHPVYAVGRKGFQVRLDAGAAAAIRACNGQCMFHGFVPPFWIEKNASRLRKALQLKECCGFRWFDSLPRS